MENLRPLCLIPMGKTGSIKKITGKDIIKRRLMDLGFVEGTAVKAVRKSPTGDPTAYLVKGVLIALRKEEASMVLCVEGGVSNERGFPRGD
ncbi:MAG: ferrous iron transport protein A [Clostridia bacterium]|nr:ferrous iron transport protein A [Clostridia bacterium]